MCKYLSSAKKFIPAGGESKEYLVLIVSVRVKTVNISIFLSESDNYSTYI